MPSNRAFSRSRRPFSVVPARQRTRLAAALVPLSVLSATGGLPTAAAVAQEHPGFFLTPERQQALDRQRAHEVEAYAKAKGISTAEAGRRLKWQRLATTKLVANGKRDLAGSFGGVWIDPDTGRVKLGVAGQTEALKSAGRAALDSVGLEDGGDVVSVVYGDAELSAASEWLGERLVKVNEGAPNGLVFATRTDENAVVVQLPAGREVTAEQRALVNEAVERFGDAVHVGEYEGELKQRACFGLYCEPPLRAGIWIEIGGSQYCTGGFISIGRTLHYLHQMTAGHCRLDGTINSRFAPGGTWHNIGPFQNGSRGPSGDAGVIRISNPAGWNPQPYVYVTESGETPRNEVYMIRSRGTSVVGMDVCTSGASLGHSECGKVTEVNHTDFDGVGNQTRGTFCGVGGDSGAPMWKFDNAYGLQVSGYSMCDSLYTERAAAENMTNTDIAYWH